MPMASCINHSQIESRLKYHIQSIRMLEIITHTKGEISLWNVAQPASLKLGGSDSGHSLREAGTQSLGPCTQFGGWQWRAWSKTSPTAWKAAWMKQHPLQQCPCILVWLEHAACSCHHAGEDIANHRAQIQSQACWDMTIQNSHPDFSTPTSFPVNTLHLFFFWRGHHLFIYKYFFDIAFLPSLLPRHQRLLLGWNLVGTLNDSLHVFQSSASDTKTIRLAQMPSTGCHTLP